MNYYKVVNKDISSAQVELQNYIKENFDITNIAVWNTTELDDILIKCPSILKLIEPYETDIVYIAFMASQKNSVHTIHKDADAGRKSRFLMPVLNCEYSETRFYKTNKMPKICKQPNGIPYLAFDENFCEHVDTFNTNDGLALFRMDQPHCIHVSENKTNFPRITATIATVRDLTPYID